MYQLPPVAGSYIWKQPPKTAQSSTMAVHPWKDCFKMRELKISERQKGDSTFAEVLNRIRVGDHTATDVELLMTRRLDNLGLTTNSPEIFNLPFLFPLNKEVHSHNNLRQAQLREKLADELGGFDKVPILRLIAVDRFANKEGKNVPVSLLDNITDDIANTGGCAKQLELMSGSRVMLRRNVNVEDGLVNGSCGTVHSWSSATLGNGLAKFVLVKFDTHKKVVVGKEQRKRLDIRLLPADPLIVPIFPLEVTFEHEGKAVLRTQFPLAINWGCTIHKSQGSTLQKFVISTAGLKRTTCGLIYVGLSRGSTLESVHIVELDASKIKAAGAVKEEIQRLQRFSGLTVEPQPRNGLPPIRDAAVGDYQQLSIKDKEDRQRVAATGVIGKLQSILRPNTLDLTAAEERAYKAEHSANHPPQLSYSAANLATITKGLTSCNSKIPPWRLDDDIPAWNATALPVLRNFCKNNAKKIWSVIREVQKMVPLSCNGRDNSFPRPASELVRKLLPPMLDLLVPVKIQGDGNCLFAAVSLCLFGGDHHHSLLRALTVFTILLLEEYFITLAKRANWWAYSGVDFALHPQNPNLEAVCNTTREQRREMIHKTVATVWKDKIFCDLFAAHALGIVTRRPLFIYGNFLTGRRTDAVITSDTDYILPSADLVSSLTLREAFLRKDPALKAGNWLLSTCDHALDTQPIMIFNTGGQNVEHFTSLLRKDAIPAESLFPPTNTVFTEELDERMDERTRAAVGTPDEQIQDLALPPHFLRCRAEKRWDQPPKHQEFYSKAKGGGQADGDSPPSWPGVDSWPEWSKKHPASESRIFPKALLSPKINSQIFLFQGNLIQPGVDDQMVVMMDPADKLNRFLGANRSREKNFIFDQAFGEASSQEEVYSRTAYSLVDTVLEGYNCTVFAYGATGAGKTYTMLGTEKEPGVMGLALQDLFTLMAERDDEKFSITMSYLEIYNEKIRDLLKSKSKELDLREDNTGAVHVAGLSEMKAKSSHEVLRLLHTGNRRRTQEPTDANQTSSRSHAVLQVNIVKQSKARGTSETLVHSKLFMVDLAGSERAANTKNSGKRLKEGAHINRSLLALGNVINGLSNILLHTNLKIDTKEWKTRREFITLLTTAPVYV